MRFSSRIAVLAAALATVLVVLDGVSTQPEPRVQESRYTANNHNHEKKQQQDAYFQTRGPTYDFSQGSDETVEARIQLAEPYKSLIQTSARFALAQTALSNHVELDLAMDVMSDIGYMLSKPSTLIKLVKAISVAITAVIASIFFFPGAYEQLEYAWHDPSHLFNLDRFLSNGISGRTILSIIGSPDALSKIGLHDSSCRERSLCQIGEVLRCTFPQTAETAAQFASENFSRQRYRDNKYSKAFLAGFVHQNCTHIGVESENSGSCIGNMLSNMVMSRWGRQNHTKRHAFGSHSNPKESNKYQSLTPSSRF